MILLFLAAWRFAFFITNDDLIQPTKYFLLRKLENYALKKPASSRQGLSLRMRLSLKADDLAECIYCMTFWTSLLLFSIYQFRFGKGFVDLGYEVF